MPVSRRPSFHWEMVFVVSLSGLHPTALSGGYEKPEVFHVRLRGFM